MLGSSAWPLQLIVKPTIVVARSTGDGAVMMPIR
jgi:hypothetical protein